MLFKKLLIIFATCFVTSNSLPSRRIVGGYEANEGDFPYVISLRWPNMRHFCGGSIISEHWVLSAAHCTIDSTPLTVFVVAGSIHINGGVNVKTHVVSRIINHEQYQPDVFAFDVCTIRVRDPFIWSRFIIPIRLATEFVGAGESAVAMGWGMTTQDMSDDGSDILLWHSTTTISNLNCRLNLMPWILPQHLCTFSRIGQGICLGDSGGPLVINNAVVGIATAVIPCARGFPDGWDRVSTFHTWIIANSVG